MEQGQSGPTMNKSLTDQTRTLANGIGSKLSDSMSNARTGLSKEASHFADEAKQEFQRIGQIGDEIAKQGGNYVRQAEDMIRQRPLMSIAVVAGVSALTAYAAVRMISANVK